MGEVPLSTLNPEPQTLNRQVPNDQILRGGHERGDAVRRRPVRCFFVISKPLTFWNL